MLFIISLKFTYLYNMNYAISVLGEAYFITWVFKLIQLTEDFSSEQKGSRDRENQKTLSYGFLGLWM